MAEGEPFSPEETLGIIESVSQFYDPLKRSAVAINIINGFNENEFTKWKRRASDFVEFFEEHQQGDVAGVDGIDAWITRSLTLLEITDAARKELAIWQAGCLIRNELYPYANEWALRVVVLEEACRIKARKDARHARLVKRSD